MIPNTKDRELKTGGISASAEFRISIKDSGHIMTILRDTLYSDKILAVLREYASNGWDANREAGRGKMPIQIHLPTEEEPLLTIRDFGLGLSPEAVFEVYTQYGASTKRDNDNTVGVMGIGSKSGFAYADTFVVISWHGGKKRTYVAVLDKEEKGTINLLQEEPSHEPTGVKIQIAVQQKDIFEFRTTGERLFQYFVPKPKINIDLPDIYKGGEVFNHGIIYKDTVGSWTAVMGCVPYKINTTQIGRPQNKDDEGRSVTLGDYLHQLSGVLFFDIGEVQISASREELKYGDSTKAALTDKVNLLVEEFVTKLVKDIKDQGGNYWQARLRAQIMRRFSLPVPDSYKDFTRDHITFSKNLPTTFFFTRMRDQIDTIYIKTSTRLLLYDIRRNFKGYHLDQWNDIIIKPQGKIPLEEVLKELPEFLNNWKLTGIPITKLSEEPWTLPPRMVQQKAVAQKYTRKVFRLKSNKSYFSHPWSDGWEIISGHVPSKEDVYVLLDGFKVDGYSFYDYYSDDLQLANNYRKGSIPPIYGYKSTPMKTVLVEDCIGTPYLEWRKGFVHSLLTPQLQKLINYMHWSRAIPRYDENKKRIPDISKRLGDQHILSIFANQAVEGSKVMSKTTNFDPLNNLDSRTRVGETEPEKYLAIIHERYPLLSIPTVGWHVLFHEDSSKWLDYILLADSALPSAEKIAV